MDIENEIDIEDAHQRTMTLLDSKSIFFSSPVLSVPPNGDPTVIVHQLLQFLQLFVSQFGEASRHVVTSSHVDEVLLGNEGVSITHFVAKLERLPLPVNHDDIVMSIPIMDCTRNLEYKLSKCRLDALA